MTHISNIMPAVVLRLQRRWFVARFGRMPRNGVELSWAWDWFLDIAPMTCEAKS